MQFQLLPMSVISVGMTSVPLVIVRRGTVMVGMTLVPVIHINSELQATIVQ